MAVPANAPPGAHIRAAAISTARVNMHRKMRNWPP